VSHSFRSADKRDYPGIQSRRCPQAELRKSVAAQGFKYIEIIIVDDGSTDNLAGVVKSLSLFDVKLNRHPQNRGAAVARN
jgi:glycosyltransferase involved in cell wall biosynthesis